MPMMTRREALRKAGNGFGMLGLAHLLAESGTAAGTARLAGASLCAKGEAGHLSVSEWRAVTG